MENPPLCYFHFCRVLAIMLALVLACVVGSGRRRGICAACKWRINPVPYTFDAASFANDNYAASARFYLLAAMTKVSERTSLRFEETEQPGDKITVVGANECASHVGQQEVTMSLGSCSGNAGYVTHELGHALGLWHEHQRADRDKYIEVPQELTGVNWDIQNIDSHNLSYDFASVMHYPMTDGVKFTVAGKRLFRSQGSPPVGHAVTFSDLDYEGLMLVYGRNGTGILPTPSTPARPEPLAAMSIVAIVAGAMGLALAIVGIVGTVSSVAV